MRNLGPTIAGIIAVLVLLPLLLVIVVIPAEEEAADLGDQCDEPGGDAYTGESANVDADSISDTTVAGFGHSQLVNAAEIMGAADDMDLSARDQTIGVMTAIEESTLENIDYGDWETMGWTNPDGSQTSSVGLFQQQDWWGTETERTDPYQSASLFYEAMLEEVGDDRDTMEPTEVAHQVQANAFPDRYANHWDDAVDIVEYLADEDMEFAGADGDQTPAEGCATASSAGDGDIVTTAGELAWDEEVSLPMSSADTHGRDEARDEFVSVADDLPNEINTAYYTDCGVFAAATMRESGIDPDFHPRGTNEQLDYLEGSDDYETFQPSNEGELEPGDLLIVPGHIYIYTGERHDGVDGRAQGASLYSRPPSGHDFYLSDGRGDYTAARHVDAGETSNTQDDDE